MPTLLEVRKDWERGLTPLTCLTRQCSGGSRIAKAGQRVEEVPLSQVFLHWRGVAGFR